jgi:hypothetical protein
MKHTTVNKVTCLQKNVELINVKIKTIFKKATRIVIQD